VYRNGTPASSIQQHFPDIINNGSVSYFTAQESNLEAGLAKDKRTNGVDASEEVVNAFEAGIVFGRMVESRRPKRHPLWSDDEWLEALIKAVGKQGESKVREWNAGLEICRSPDEPR
jgi:hypothetical protein